MKIAQMWAVAAAMAVMTIGCGGTDDEAGCGDGGCADAARSDAAVDAGVPYVPAAGKYKVTDYTPVEDGCMIGLAVFTNSADPLDWIPVRVENGVIKIGNDRGTPPAASLGEGRLTGMTNPLARANHVKNAAPSTCEYDANIQAAVLLDDPTGKTIGLSVRETQSNRVTCTEPAGVGATCTSTWSWRLTPTGM